MRRVGSAIAVIVFAVCSQAAANPIEVENSFGGTNEWRLGKTAREREIEGYPSATSVNVGETIQIFVHTTEPTYTIEIFRAGWYGGLGARRMTSAITRNGVVQPMPAPDPVTRLIECRWLDPYELFVPPDWTSGYYLVKLTSQSKAQIYTIFVVRDDARRSDFLVQSSVTTFQAYNNWGGKSLYGHNSDGTHATKVSFHRPYDIHHGLGTGDFLNNGGWELNMVRWLERNGYDVTYCTDVDTHRNGAALLNHKAFLVVGHDEYWTWQMREHVEAARDAGIHLGFFGANICYWQIRLEDDGRTIVAYKAAALDDDPLARDADPTNDRLVTTTWRDPPVSRPEASMIGQMYVYDGIEVDLVVYDASSWVFAGSGLKAGDRIKGLMGYEVDQIAESSPPNVIRLARSPFTRRNGLTNWADTTLYEAPSGAIVFAAGTIQWSWGLDDHNVPDSRPSRRATAVDRITRNILDRFRGVLPPPPRRRVSRH